jgi:hypothetical protein
MRGVALILLVATSGAAEEPSLPSRPPTAPTAEATRVAAEYFVQKAGVTWVYQLEKTKGRVTITDISDWRSRVSFSLGRRVGTTTWRLKDGAWLERSAARGDAEAVVLPPTMSFGTRWRATASIERGGGRPAQYEVMALEATVDLPNGQSAEQCLAVLETELDGSEPYTHFYAPNIGKVAVQGPSGWLYRLVEFHAASRHSE